MPNLMDPTIDPQADADAKASLLGGIQNAARSVKDVLVGGGFGAPIHPAPVPVVPLAPVAPVPIVTSPFSWLMTRLAGRSLDCATSGRRPSDLV